MVDGSLASLFELSAHGSDTFVGEGLAYPWGGLYGGHIVAQALRAAQLTVDERFSPHSLRAYFIRRGDNTEPIRYEVDRIRNGRSFETRRVVARQAIGAILNLETSFQVPEQSPEGRTVSLPAGLPSAEDLPETSWSSSFQRRSIPFETLATLRPDGLGRVGAWFRITEDLGDSAILNKCALAYISDDLPTEAVIVTVPELQQAAAEEKLFSASLDHTVWFHRPVKSAQWHYFEMSCHAYTNGRGVTFGYVFSADGTHVATVAQEVLVRRRES